jgi:hypothetical protein
MALTSRVTDAVAVAANGYRQEALFEARHSIPGDFASALEYFATQPYKDRPYSARNWGHPLHSLCSYASKMKPAIASMLVALFTEPGATVLDPFAGSGTIPFEACLQGRRGLAVDLSPLAFCLSSAKVNPPTMASAVEYMADLDAHIRRSAPSDVVLTDDEIADFYHPATLNEVMLAKEYFEHREAEGAVHPAHWFVKSCVLHILHGNRPYALSRRSHGIIPIPPKGPVVYKSLFTSLREKAARMGLGQLPSGFRGGQAFLADALDQPFAAHSVDAIITSPPFLGTTEFLRQNRVRLWFTGWTYLHQSTMKESGAFLEYRRTLDIYREVLTEFRRVIAESGLVIIHLGVVKKMDMGLAVRSMAETHGFEPVALVYEDTTDLESHGRTDRGATHQHQFLFLKASR